VDLCGYQTAPGYGDRWNQSFCTKSCLSVGLGVYVEFDAAWDAEPNYDWTTLQVDQCDNHWLDVYGGYGVWDGRSESSPGVPGSVSHSIRIDDRFYPSGSLRIRFNFDSDGYESDYDGLYNSDGAFILDNIVVYDTTGTLVALEDFEDEAWGDHDADDWESCNLPGYGSYAGLFQGGLVVQEDPCIRNLSCFWGFFEGSTAYYSCGGWPGQRVVPYDNTLDQCLQNHIWSPVMPVAGSGSVWELSFQTYRDLLIPPLVFYDFYVRSWHGDPPSCPGRWVGDIYVYYGPNKDWHTSPPDERSIGQWIEPGATAIQVALACRDMCCLWSGSTWCSCHSHSPLFDNVAVYRVAANGPQWSVLEVDCFQDNFPEDGTITGPARIDAARDLVDEDNVGRIQPGDSMVVTVDDPDNAMGFHIPRDMWSGAAVYCYVSVDGPHSADPPASFAMSGWIDDPRYTVVGLVSAGGRNWAQIQCDSVYTDAGAVVAGKYCIDLNDNLFTPGDSIYYFYGARNFNNSWTWYSYWIPGPNVVYDIETAASYPHEVSVLPAVGRDVADGGRGGHILYVDGMDDRDGQVWFDTAFELLGIDGEVDRYDIIAPSSSMGNHPSERVANISQQILGIYRTIIWNTGYLTTSWSEGDGDPGKSDDTGFVLSFLDGLESPGGIYLTGDNAADQWSWPVSPSAIALKDTYMNFLVESGNHRRFVNISPLVIGETGPGTFFRDAVGEPDTMVAYGGCPFMSNFDVLTQDGSSVVQMQYHQSSVGPGLGPKPAVLSQVTHNGTVDVGFILEGFGYQYIRDAHRNEPMARVEHLMRILRWLNGPLDDPVSARPTTVAVNELRQNRPNPFNPTTTIEFQVKHTGHATLKVYNVAGQLVRTLVDERVTAGKLHTVWWKGLNNAGQSVSSGVYFYRLEAGEFTATKKMVLLR
jgi:hypothetical protein